MLKNVALFLFLFLQVQSALSQTGMNCREALFINTDDCSDLSGFNNAGVNGNKKGSCNTAGQNNSLWFSFIATSSSIELTMVGQSLQNFNISIFDSEEYSCTDENNFTEIICTTVSSLNNQIIDNLIPHRVYYMLVDGVNNETGSFRICMKSSVAPSNDEICNAILIPTKNFCSSYGSYHNLGATSDLKIDASTFYPSCFDNNVLHGVWFKFEAISNQIDLAIQGAVNGLKNPQIAILQPPNNDCDRTDYWNFNELACAKNSDNSNKAIISTNSLNIGETYYLVVDGTNLNQGFFSICANHVSTDAGQNDNCIDAIPLCPNETISGTTIGATSVNDIPANLWTNCNTQQNDMVYYTFNTGDVVNDVVLDVAYACTGAKIQLGVFKPIGTPCQTPNNQWTNILCIEEGFFPRFQTTIPATDMDPNTTYYLVIDDYPNYSCNFEIHIRGNAGPNAGNNMEICNSQGNLFMNGHTPTGGTWSGPGIIDANIGKFSPDEAGIGNHTIYYQVGNCKDSKNIIVSVAEVFTSNDQFICSGDTAQIFGQPLANPSMVVKNFTNKTAGDLYDNISNFTRTVFVEDIFPDKFNLQNGFIQVCVNMVHQRCKDLELELESPSGTKIILSRANGAIGNQYLNTCFVANSPINITDVGLNSFQGSFKPEDDFDAFNNESVNGTWKLRIRDLNSNNFGYFYDWSIHFYDKNNFVSTIVPWNPNNNISNQFINNPLVYPNSNQRYSYIAVDQNGCGSNNGVDISVGMHDLVTINTNKDSLCLGDSTDIIIETGTSFNYDVTLTDGTNNIHIPNASHGTKITVKPTETTEYFLKSVYAVNGTECVLADGKIIIVKVFSNPSVTYTDSLLACPGSTVNLNYHFAPLQNLNFTMDTGLSNLQVNNLIENPYTLSFTAHKSHTYRISNITFNDRPNCFSEPNTGTHVIVPAIPEIQLSGANSYCAGDEVKISVSISEPGTYNMQARINGKDTLLENQNDNFEISFTAESSGQIEMLSILNKLTNCTTNLLDQVFSYEVFPLFYYEFISDTCINDRTGANISFEMFGGDPNPYFVNGVSSGNIYQEFVPTGNSYSYVLSENSPCNNLYITGEVDCSCKSFSGTINTEAIRVCANDTFHFPEPSDFVLEHDDSIAYILHNGDLNNIGTILQSNLDGNFYVNENIDIGTSYVISVVVGNFINQEPWIEISDMCLSFASKEITFYPLPSISISGTDSICLGDEAILQAVIDGNGPFDYKYQVNGEWFEVNEVNTNSTLSVPLSYSDDLVITEVKSSNPTCWAYPDIAFPIHVFDRPIAKNIVVSCNEENTHFTVSFDIIGGLDDSIFIFTDDVENAEKIQTRSYTSEPFPSPSDYFIGLVGYAPCANDIVAGFKNCNCETFAGNMNPQTLYVCKGDTAKTTFIDDFVLDSNDSITFVLHDLAGYQLGTVLEQNHKPEFVFNESLSFNTTYYISAVAGNFDDNTVVDFNHECTIAAKGTPVIFRDLPALLEIEDAIACKNTEVKIPLSITGKGPYKLYYQSPQGSGNWQINDGASYFYLLAEETATYQLTQLVDGNTPACSANLNESFTLDVKPLPSIEFTSPDSICEGLLAPLDYTITGIAPFGFIIKHPNGNTDIYEELTSSGTVYFSPSESGNYAIQQLSESGIPKCTNDSVFSFPLHVIPSPLVSMSASAVCAGQDAEIALSFEGEAPFHITLYDNQQGHSLADSVNYTIYKTDTIIQWTINDSTLVQLHSFFDNSSFRCEAEGVLPSIFIPVIPNPTISINYHTTICFGDSAFIPVTISGTPPYDVILSINGKDSLLEMDGNTNNIAVSPYDTTKYHVISISDRTIAKCSSSGTDTATVFVNKLPTAILAGPDSICELDSVSLFINLQGAAPFKYEMTYPGGQLIEQNATSSMEKLLLTESGWIIMQTIFDNATPICSNKKVDSIYVHVNPLPTIELTANPTVCRNQPWIVDINATGNGPFSLTFDSNGEEVVFQDILPNDQITFVDTDDGNYILLEVSDASNPTCTTNPIDTLVLDVLELPSVDFTSSKKEGCSPWEVYFIPAYNQDSVERIEWNFNNMATSILDTPTYVFPAGKHDITLYAYGENGCINSMNKVDYIHAFPLPLPDFLISPNQIKSWHPVATFYDKVSQGYPYKWQIDTLTTDSNQFPITYQFPLDKQNNYVVTLFALNEFGCLDSVSKTVFVIGEMNIYIPSAFTPGDNGINDEFKPIYSGNHPENYKFTIFDRWGQLIFSSENPEQGWDGTFASKKCPAGLYSWKLSIKNEFTVETRLISGLVTLLR